MGYYLSVAMLSPLQALLEIERLVWRRTKIGRWFNPVAFAAVLLSVCTSVFEIHSHG